MTRKENKQKLMELYPLFQEVLKAAEDIGKTVNVYADPDGYGCLKIGDYWITSYLDGHINLEYRPDDTDLWDTEETLKQKDSPASDQTKRD